VFSDAVSIGLKPLAKSDGKFSKLLFWAFLLLLAWVPLPLGSNRPWSWSFLSFSVGILLILWAFAAFRHPSMAKLPGRVFVFPGVLFGLVILWALVQTTMLTPIDWHDPLWQDAAKILGKPLNSAITTDRETAIEHALRLVAYAGIFWIAAQFGRDPSNARAILWCISIAAIAYASYGLSVYTAGNKTILGYAKWANTGDLTSTFVGRAAYGAYAGMGILTILGLVLHSVSQTARSAAKEGQRLSEALPPSIYCLVCGAIVVTIAMMFTHSRGALLVTAIGAAVMLSILIGRANTRRKPLIALSVLVFGSGFVILEMSGRATLGRVMQLAHQGTGRDTVHEIA
tara:strand:- start:1220 stop:2248 length:1029 start_codon:yes stop_codon:yes gene_type:complete